MQLFRLANVLIKQDDFTTQHPELYFRAQSSLAFNEAEQSLSLKGDVDFLTYFNAFSNKKWRQYTVVDTVWLHLELAGDACTLSFLEAHRGDAAAAAHEFSTSCAASASFASYDIELPQSSAVLTAFLLACPGTTRMRNAYYYTKVEEHCVRPINLALCTTTFKKEEYIVPNIEAVKREVLNSDEPIAQGFHMYVVDNGQTLDAEALSDLGVSVCPNANVGGAGGFARGMMEAMASDAAVTHVALMDDDVRVSPESFKRTFNLLSLAAQKYKDAFLSGAMLSLEQPHKQYEDVGFVRKDGLYDKVKPDLSVDKVADLVTNESLDVEVENAYGAWWYCCIPVSAIKTHGLPLPLFVRCDDVEYGLRCQPTIMTMNGICVWHASFEGRFRASVDCYQYVRNFLITTVVSQKTSEKLFMLRLLRTFTAYTRSLNYESAELLLDGLEDYLKGPAFIKTASGEELMRLKGQKNEKLVPIEQLDPRLREALEIDYHFLGAEDDRSLFLKLLELAPHNKHVLPEILLKAKPEAVYYSRGAYPGSKTMRCKVLVALDATGENAHVRIMDKARYQQLRRRYKQLTHEYAHRKEALAQEYRAAFPCLTSHEFWRQYLGLQ